MPGDGLHVALYYWSDTYRDGLRDVYSVAHIAERTVASVVLCCKEWAVIQSMLLESFGAERSLPPSPVIVNECASSTRSGVGCGGWTNQGQSVVSLPWPLANFLDASSIPSVLWDSGFGGGIHGPSFVSIRVHSWLSPNAAIGSTPFATTIDFPRHR